MTVTISHLGQTYHILVKGSTCSGIPITVKVVFIRIKFTLHMYVHNTARYMMHMNEIDIGVISL